MRRAAAALGAVLATLVALGGVAPVASAASEFPVGWEGFHTYAEMVTDIQAVAAAHPDIVSLFSIGTSYKGRTIWAAKVSDNVATDEAEPEVLFDGLHHAREHMSLEMTLKILHWLAGGYGSDSRITNIVDTREVWIIFSVNPDGAEFDIKDGRYHLWRKNRQPNAGVTAIGTDLNRNYDYRWGCCGGSSKNPANLMYRGARPFSAPETRAVRDFVLSRVVDGWQQIRTHISFHTSGRLVMWPYGYTLTNVPGDMSRNDHAAFVAMGKKMASLNGYTPEQGSDLYITSGRFGDWMYGTQRVFTYTFEMTHGWYPDDSEIAKETARNRSAILYLIEQADCPWRAAGLAAADCGAFYDDLELYHGWTGQRAGHRHRHRRHLAARQPAADQPPRAQAAGHHRERLAGPGHRPRGGRQRRCQRRRRRPDLDHLTGHRAAGDHRPADLPLLPRPLQRLEQRRRPAGGGHGRRRRPRRLHRARRRQRRRCRLGAAPRSTSAPTPARPSTCASRPSMARGANLLEAAVDDVRVRRP